MHAEHVVKAVLLGFQYDVVATFYCLDIMSGQSELAGQMWKMAGNWPVASCYFQLWICFPRVLSRTFGDVVEEVPVLTLMPSAHALLLSQQEHVLVVLQSI